MTKLVIFDVDGTLLHSNAADEACFVRAFAEALDIAAIDTNWLAYKHTTDSGITEQVFRERLGRGPRADEIARLRDRFVALLGAELARRPEGAAPVAGAAAMLAALPDGWAPAIATGGWRASARLKLATAGLDVADIPAAFAEDGPSRAAIVTSAWHRAREHHGVAAFDRVVCIGDGAWDARAAAEVGLPLVGVATGPGAGTLYSEGVSHVVDDFTDVGGFAEALEQATVPVAGRRTTRRAARD